MNPKTPLTKWEKNALLLALNCFKEYEPRMYSLFEGQSGAFKCALQKLKYSGKEVNDGKTK